MNEIPPSTDKYQRDVCQWVDEAIAEGETFLKSQYGYEDIDKSIAYIQGDQLGKVRPRDIAAYTSNRLGKTTIDLVAAMTDVKLIFGFRTFNERFAHHAEVLNKLTKAWWINNLIDLKLGGAVQLAIPAGCSYMQLIFNSSLNGGGGDLDVIPLDCRDVLPVRPSNSISIQDSVGIILRRFETVNYLRSKYPHLKDRIFGERDASFYTPRRTAWSRLRQAVMTPVNAIRGNTAYSANLKIPGLDIRTLYVRDESLNETGDIVRMGYGPDGESYSWSYDVLPGDPLYPRGRTIVCSKNLVFYDGPNVYWHGMFPVVKLPMDLSFFYPDSFLSKSVVADLIPMQDVINEIINGITDAVNQVLKRGLIADKNAVPKTLLEKLNSREPGFKMQINPVAGKGVQWAEAPILPPYVFDFLQFLTKEIEYLSGSVDMTNLAKVRQIPSADSVEALMQAMNPVTRMRGRLMEATLREMADIIKFNFFQFYNTRRRVAILGPQGMDFEDFDFDPGTLIPDDLTEGYQGMDRTQRAIKHASNFPFYITPNSLLEIAQMTNKLLAMQARRQGDIDWETYMETMEFPNIPQIKERLSSEIDQKIAMLQQVQAGRAGRPPTGQAMPHLEVKDQGTRPTVAES